ncbi:hypothetical protein HNQ56_002482 [Anaerotaenia torta]|uniref:peptidoglycan editing factor PgeF n=1 Tax=Anaerotaenia torta TaxID=433293 RepID=UPI003D1AA4A9
MKFQNSSDAQIDFSREVPYLSFPVLSELPFIRHGFSTRLGGVSEGVYSSMNLGNTTGLAPDAPENIRENFRRMAEGIGVDIGSLVLSQQVHKTNIRLVTGEDRGKGVLRPRGYAEIDGLITQEPNVTLVTKYADCVPLYFVDVNRRSIGLSHSGWRGTVAEIGRITAEEMHKHFGSRLEDIIAVIGPSICHDCFEIGVEVAAEFERVFPGAYDTGILTPRSEAGKFSCDLWEANRQILLLAGLSEENIHTSRVCTCCNEDLLFSHRKTMGQRGSLGAFLAITE